MKKATASRTSLINMFHGKCPFRKALLESGMPESRIKSFFRDLSAIFAKLNTEYWNELPAARKGKNERVLRAKRRRAIAPLSRALSRVHKEPFSKLVSPFIDIKIGKPTELGNLVAMSPVLARKINSPKSELISLMHSLGPEAPFTDLVNYSYGAFGYARSGITNAAPGEPLAWLPLGNSIYLSKLAEELSSSSGSITVVNLGAGPGALEGMILSKLKEFLPRIKIVSVEQDKASLKALRAKKQKAPSLQWDILEGNFMDFRLQQKISCSSPNPFVISGYSMNHVSLQEAGQVISWMNSLSWRPKSYVQIHGVSGGQFGGGQSPVNRIFFNFMPLYHLSVFQPDNAFTMRGFSKMPPGSAAESAKEFPHLFLPGTTPAAARAMLSNGSISIFSMQLPRGYNYQKSSSYYLRDNCNSLDIPESWKL